MLYEEIMTKVEPSDNGGWKLEDGRPVTAEDLIREVTEIPRTRFWRLSHMVFLWPAGSDPGRTDPAPGGFADGFVFEVVAVEGGVDWLVQAVNGGPDDRTEGRAATGSEAVREAFVELNRRLAARA